MDVGPRVWQSKLLICGSILDEGCSKNFFWLMLLIFCYVTGKWMNNKNTTAVIKALSELCWLATWMLFRRSNVVVVTQILFWLSTYLVQPSYIRAWDQQLQLTTNWRNYYNSLYSMKNAALKFYHSCQCGPSIKGCNRQNMGSNVDCQYLQTMHLLQ